MGWRGTDLSSGTARAHTGEAESWSLCIGGQFLGRKGRMRGYHGAAIAWLPFAPAGVGADAASCSSLAPAPAGTGTPRSQGGGISTTRLHSPSWAAPAQTHPLERGAASGPHAGPKVGGWEQVAHPGMGVRIIPGPEGHLSGSTYASLFAPEEMFSS